MTVAERLTALPRERLAGLVSSAAYGTVLVISALSVVGVTHVGLGYGVEIVLGVGVGTWLVHVFAELLGRHVHEQGLTDRATVWQVMTGCSPILLATVLPAAVVAVGRHTDVSDEGAKAAAIIVAVLQLLAIGRLVAVVSPTRRVAEWVFAGVTVLIGTSVVVLTLALGH